MKLHRAFFAIALAAAAGACSTGWKPRTVAEIERDRAGTTAAGRQIESYTRQRGVDGSGF